MARIGPTVRVGGKIARNHDCRPIHASATRGTRAKCPVRLGRSALGVGTTTWFGGHVSRQPTPAHTRTQPRRHSLTVFFTVAFAVSWSAWLPAVLSGDPATGLVLLGSFGPLLAALLTTALFDGRTGFRDLGRRLLIWRVRPYWYAVVLVLPALLSLARTAVSVALGAPLPRFDDPPFVHAYPIPSQVAGAVPWLAFLPLVFVQQLLVGSAMGEEPGWRGYALPRMQWRHSALRAGVLLGLLWGLWHLPLWLWRDQRSPEEIGWELLGIIATSVLFTWVFNHTDGSLLLAMLFHASIATTGLFLAESHLGPAVDVVLAWLLVASVTAAERRMRFTQDRSASS
jgi:membrane protease YdiL (CAAX protease family)